MTKFEQYLRKIHAKNYTGTDDDMSDDFEHWITQLENEDLMKYADEMLDQFAKDVEGRVERKSVTELEPVIPNAMQSLCDRISFKEGYNKSVDITRTALKELLEEWRI